MTLLEKLAPYLPYDIKIQEVSVMTPRVVYTARKLSVEVLNYFDLTGIKPILRPLSDLYKNEFIYLKQELDGVYTSGYVNHLIAREVIFCTLSYYYVSLLLQNHFDVFNMIEDGLAIDINTIKK